MNGAAGFLFDTTEAVLTDQHYLGPSTRAKFTWHDADGVVVITNPTSRHLPPSWLELQRWCLTGGVNAGTRQWRGLVGLLRERFKTATTVVSYSDPSIGHTGALYRACNWLWAPTWMRLRTPPSGNGTRSGKRQEAKDRWVYLLRPDATRESVLAVKDEALMQRMPWASYREPKWKRGRVQPGGGGDYSRWRAA